MKRAGNLMEKIQDLDNLYLAYFKSKRGKSQMRDVVHYERHLEENLQTLQHQLRTGLVETGPYHYFTILDPKERLICAAAFPQRVLHHAIMNVCHPYFEKHLIYDTYSTRIDKGIYIQHTVSAI